jgi:putative membrane protein
MIIIRWFVRALIIMVAAYIIPGVFVGSFWVALVAALVLGLLNFLVRPVLLILTLPITILTLGLFSLVINGLMILLLAALVPGFSVAGLWSAILFSLVVSLANYIIAVNKW